jgi:uncharacterized protein (UPF0179 family)
LITLIGKKLAKKGLIFMHCGSAPECDECRFKGTCVDSLEEGRMYIIKNIKDSEQKCNLHEGHKVKVIEVEKANIKALVDSKRAFEGSMISIKHPQCEEECEMHDMCFPEGLYEEDKCKIVKTLGKPSKKCLKGYDLNRVILKY